MPLNTTPPRGIEKNSLQIISPVGTVLGAVGGRGEDTVTKSQSPTLVWKGDNHFNMV